MMPNTHNYISEVVTNDSIKFMDNCLLNTRIISHYNMELTKDNVNMMLDNYIKLQYKYLNIIPPRITASYEIRYDNFTRKKSDPVGYYNERKFDTENEVEYFYGEIKDVLLKMTNEELLYYNENLLRKKSEELTAEKLCLSRKVLKPFYKNILSLEMLDEFGNPSNEKHLECCIILDNVAKEDRRKIIHVLYYSNIYDYCTDGENKYKIHIFKRSNKIKTIEELNLMLHNETIPIFTLGDGVNDLEMIKQYNGFFITNTMKEYRDYSLGEYDSISSLIGDIQLKKVRRR
ncbi:MAG TPA: hypothetical protein PLT65_02990 [Bacilli bacterium]|nr:hypothetical protein [Bacilli bacterium]